MKKQPKQNTDEEIEFAAFWQLYPRHDAKAKALKSFRTARKKTALATILQGVRNYPFNPDPKYQPMPATWLNQERWESVSYQQPQTVIAKVTKLSWRDAYDGGAEIVPGPARYGASKTTGPIIEGDLTDG